MCASALSNLGIGLDICRPEEEQTSMPIKPWRLVDCGLDIRRPKEEQTSTP
jgi:hypothetical protein